MELYLGIDGGQSSTVALIGDERGRVIGFASGGPCNHVSSQEAAAKFGSVIRSCVSDACLDAGLDPSRTHFESACCGMSGGPQDKRRLLAEIINTKILVAKDDGEIALLGATAGGPGIVVIAGTGSIAYGCNKAGLLLRAGGWGYAFGDEGSAFEIVRQAVRASLRQEEGWGPNTALFTALLSATGSQNANGMLHAFYTNAWPRARIAGLSEVVDQISIAGDPVARGILEQAGQSLASLVACIRVQLFPIPTDIQIAFAGGVFRSEVVLDRFRLLVELTDGCRCTPSLMSSAAGALLLAYRARRRDVTLSNVPSTK